MPRKKTDTRQIEAFDSYQLSLRQGVKFPNEKPRDEWSDAKTKLRDFTEEALNVALQIGGDWRVWIDQYGRWSATSRLGHVVHASTPERLVLVVKDPLLFNPASGQLNLFSS